MDGHPVTRLLEGEVQKLVQMEERLARRVVGQAEALRAVSNAVRRARWPVGSSQPAHRLLPVPGPTGVGKTERARALAEFLFDDERAMVRIDMSEYMEKHTVARLIGAPPGYVGFEEGGQLTEAVRRRPYPSSSSTRSRRRTPTSGTRCSSCSTTAGSRTATGGPWTSATPRDHDLEPRESPLPAVADSKKVRPLVLEELRQHLRLEFLNRIDEVIVFRSLGSRRSSRSWRSRRRISGSGLAGKRITLELTDAAKAVLARGRVRPGLRSAAAQADAPAAGPGSARAPAPRGRVFSQGTRCGDALGDAPDLHEGRGVRALSRDRSASRPARSSSDVTGKAPGTRRRGRRRTRARRGARQGTG